MNELDLLEYYEKKETELQLLTIVKDQLTPKGIETFNKIEKWLNDNLDKYIELRDRLFTVRTKQVGVNK